LNGVRQDRSQLNPSIQADGLDRQAACQFLRFHLRPNFRALLQIANLSVDAVDVTQQARVSELMNIPIDRVVPIPHLPTAVMGVYNWRGEVLWIVDLAVLLDLTPDRVDAVDRHRSLYRTLHPTISISSAVDNAGEYRTIGLVVDEIADIEWYEPESISASVDRSRTPWASGWARSTTGEKLAILDGRVIFEASNLHADL
jgi:positive phototaxis protein PixI